MGSQRLKHDLATEQNSRKKNNQWVKEETKREMKKYLETNENGNSVPKHMGCSKSSSQRGVHSHKHLHEEKNECGIGCPSRVLFYCSIDDLQYFPHL